MRRVRLNASVGFLCCAVVVSACQTSTPVLPTPTLDIPTPSVSSTAVATITSTPSPQPTPAPTEDPDCRNDLLFLSDLTITDGTQLSPGEVFDKRWSVENAGTCSWGPGYRLVRIGQDFFEGPTEMDLYPARAGANAILQVILTAPGLPGEYVSRWRAQAPDGTFFGEELYILIVVAPE